MQNLPWLLLGVPTALVLLARPGAAQVRDSTATLVVQVMDTTDAPIAQAEVLLRRAKVQAASGPTGRVVLRNLVPGWDTLLVRRLGYGPLEVMVRLTPGDTLTVDAVLDAKVVALEEITVVGRPGLTTFERHMRSAIFSPPNSFYPPEALDTFPPEIHVREILLRSGIARRPHGRTGPLRLSCPSDGFRRHPIPLKIVLNGIVYPDPDDTFFDVQLQNARVRALEIYRNCVEVPLDLPAEVSGGNCSDPDKGCVVVVWTT